DGLLFRCIIHHISTETGTMNARTMLLTLTVVGGLPVLAVAQSPLGAPWDSVGRILKTTGTSTGGYYRYTWPRRDISLKIGDVTVAPALALGAWAGFGGEEPMPR